MTCNSGSGTSGAPAGHRPKTSRPFMQSRPTLTPEKAAGCLRRGGNFFGVVGDPTSANVPGEPFGRTTVRMEQPGISFPMTRPGARLIAGAKTVWQLYATATSSWYLDSLCGMARIPILKERAFGLTPNEGNHGAEHASISAALSAPSRVAGGSRWSPYHPLFVSTTWSQHLHT
jgi:hypothetical protein